MTEFWRNFGGNLADSLAKIAAENATDVFLLVSTSISTSHLSPGVDLRFSLGVDLHFDLPFVSWCRPPFVSWCRPPFFSWCRPPFRPPIPLDMLSIRYVIRSIVIRDGWLLSGAPRCSPDILGRFLGKVHNVPWQKNEFQNKSKYCKN